jgi:DNA-binding NarL/FixJ family response regulator
MIRQVFIYGIALAAAALMLDWLEYRHAMRLHSTEFYAVAVALIFTVIGLWAGHRLTPVSVRAHFTRNDAAIAALGLSAREVEVLALIADGHSNKVIARRLAISPNTVKTHMARLYEKLDVASRTQAIGRARALEILP